MENYRRWDISRTATNIVVHQNRLSFCKPVSKRPYPDTCLRTDLQHATVDYSHSCHPVRHRTRIRLRRINGNTAPQRCCKPAEWTYYFVDKLLSGACPKWNIYRNRFNHVIMDCSYTDRQHRTKLQCNLAGKTPPFSLSQNNWLFFHDSPFTTADSHFKWSYHFYDYIYKEHG